MEKEKNIRSPWFRAREVLTSQQKFHALCVAGLDVVFGQMKLDWTTYTIDTEQGFLHSHLSPDIQVHWENPENRYRIFLKKIAYIKSINLFQKGIHRSLCNHSSFDGLHFRFLLFLGFFSDGIWNLRFQLRFQCLALALFGIAIWRPTWPTWNDHIIHIKMIPYSLSRRFSVLVDFT